MKIRKGFVSNSSSSSFIIKIQDELTLDKCKKLLLDTWGISLIKAKHLAIFSFHSNIDYNPMILKICLLSFSFAI